MANDWKQTEFKGFVKDGKGFDVQVVGTFKYRVGDPFEVELVSLKDMDGRKFDASDSEIERIENDCRYELYRRWHGSYATEGGRKMNARNAKFARNARVARQLLKIARELVSEKKVAKEVEIFDFNTGDVTANMKTAGMKTAAFVESPWLGEDTMTVAEKIGVMLMNLFKSDKQKDAERKKQESIDKVNKLLNDCKMGIFDSMKDFVASTFDSKDYKAITSDANTGFVVFRKSDSARVAVKFVPGECSVVEKDGVAVLQNSNETPFLVHIDIPKVGVPMEQGKKVDQSIYGQGTNLKAQLSSFTQVEDYIQDKFLGTTPSAPAREIKID